MQTGRLKGACHCGNLRLDVTLAADPATLVPRACDCGFCTLHGALWVSDPEGHLRVHVGERTALLRYRQGSRQADMNCCGCCGVLVFASVATEGGLYAVVNGRTLEDLSALAAPVTVSPRMLGAGEKLDRWRQIWFAGVEVRHGPHT